MQPMLPGLFRLLYSSLALGCLHGPLSWSPDGQWLAYTLSTRSSVAHPLSEWIYDTAELTHPAARPSTSSNWEPSGEGPRYRIWATQRNTLNSVLIEDSIWPLSPPTWGPDGRRLFYSRFVPRPDQNAQDVARGRLEMVVQEAVDQKRVVHTIPELQLDSAQLAAFAEARAVWSPDGQYLAVPRPGPIPAMFLLRADQGRLLKTLEHAARPSWSPEGSRLAYLREARSGSSLPTLMIMGHDFGSSRQLIETSPLCEAPTWSSDGQTILILAGKPQVQSRQRELELVRVVVDSGAVLPVMKLGPLLGDPSRMNRMLTLGPGESRPTSVRGVSLAFDREQDQCLFTTDLEGQDSLVGWSNLRNAVVYKKFHPLDPSMRLGALSVTPDLRILALRIETPGGVCPPVFCDPSTETISLLAPDGPTRNEWLDALVAISRSVLRGSLPRATIGMQGVPRPTILPVPGEISNQSTALTRLKRLGKIGKALLDDRTSGQSDSSGEDPTSQTLDEHRLFFNYLRQDYAAAEADLEALDTLTENPVLKTRLLSVRAQILSGSGQFDRARDLAAYLQRIQGPDPMQIETTPVGHVMSPTPDPARRWPDYLTLKLAERAAVPKQSLSSDISEEDDASVLRFQRPLGGPGDGRVFEEGPMAPFAPREEMRLFDRAMDRPFRPERQPRFFPPPIPAQPRPPIAPLRPRFDRSDRGRPGR